jgi:hypothetical protein
MNLSFTNLFSSLSGGVSGPLSSLYENKYKRVNYQYPRNLGTDSTRRHYIGFTILEPDPTYANNIKADFENNFAILQNQSIQSLDARTNGVETSSLNSVLKEGYNAASAAVQSIAQSDVKRRPRTYINLYVPDTVNVTYNAGYGDVSLTTALGTPYFLAQGGASLYDTYKNFEGGGLNPGNIINAVGSDPFLRQLAGQSLSSGKLSKLGIDGDAASKLLLRGIGQAVNPQMQVLFQGLDFRRFQFDFTMTPYSAEEAKTIKDIVYQFKYASAPEINKNGVFGSQGMFFKVPDMFDIKFYYNGTENQNVHKITRSVLESVSVDYAPIGWATYDGGEPVQTKLTLQFKEIEIVDKNRIKEGY